MSSRGDLIIIVGRPNVGKSTLFNRLVGEAAAITSPIAGTTRDWLESEANADGRMVRLADTGGWNAGGAVGDHLDELVRRLLAKAGAVIMVVSRDMNPHADDMALANAVRKAGPPVLAVCNKCDRPGDDAVSWEWSRLGLGAALPVSAAQNRNLSELRRRIAALLSSPDPGPVPAGRAKPALCILLGQPNVGKSSLFNALLEEERSLVDAAPGTTRDPVIESAILAGSRWDLVDTAGVSRRRDSGDAIAKDAQSRALRSLQGSDVAVLILDLTVPLARQDLRLASEIEAEFPCLAVALNKVDLLEPGRSAELLPKAVEFLHKRFPGMGRFPVLMTSAVSGEGVPALRQVLADLMHLRGAHISPQALAGTAHDWPSPGKAWILRQTGTAPPTFSVIAPPGAKLGVRFVANRLREAFGLHGVPVRIRWGHR
jgi:GTP-binding protein